MGTDILKEQYNLLLENQKKKIKKLQDKRLATTSNKINGSSFDVDTNEDSASNVEREIDKLNDVDLDSSSDDLNLNTKKPPNKTSASTNNASSITFNRNNSKLVKSSATTLSDRDANNLRESLTFADKLREMKDENGRFRKLLAEKEYEIKYLKKQLDEEKLAFTGGVVGSDAIATKIVDLSKKIRELTADLEGERTRNKQLNKTVKDLEHRLSQNGPSSNNRNNNRDDDDDDNEENETEKLAKENKDLKDKLNQTSGKMMEYKSQCDIYKQDLKKYHRALEKEVGDNIDIKAILSGQSTWRGRQQQISALQHKLADLKQQLGMMDTRNYTDLTIDEEYEVQFMRTGDIASGIASGVSSAIKSEQMSLMSFGTAPGTALKRSALDARNRDDIKKIEKEKKEQVEKVKREYEALENDYNTVKSKADAMKARNNVLTNEVKTNREQVKTLLEKGKHDDELIEALLQKQNQMKNLIDDLTRKNETLNKELDEKTKEAQVKSMQDKNMIEQLKGIITEREKRVRQLEDDVQMKQLREQSSSQLQFILHGGHSNSNGTNHGVATNHDDVLLNDDNENNRIGGSNLSSRNNSRAEYTSTRLASASATNVNGNKNNATASRLSGREIASSRHTIKGTKLNSRPNSAASNANAQTNGINKKEHEDLKLEYHELVTLNKSSEIERTRLLELVKTLQKRLESFNEKFCDSENKYNEQRRRCVNLERQIEKAKLESSSTSKTNKHQSTASATLDQYKFEELETSLLIQKDENDALKAALKSTLEAKEEDLRLYVEMLESTKRVFLDGLKEFKQLTSK